MFHFCVQYRSLILVLKLALELFLEQFLMMQNVQVPQLLFLWLVHGLVLILLTEFVWEDLLQLAMQLFL